MRIIINLSAEMVEYINQQPGMSRSEKIERIVQDYRRRDIEDRNSRVGDWALPREKLELGSEGEKSQFVIRAY